MKDNGHMVEILNQNFPSVFTIENRESIPESPIAPRGITLMKIGLIDEKDVRKYLDKPETNKSTGSNGLSPSLLKELEQQILKSLTFIYNLTLQQKQVPEDWKQVNVTQIYKKGDMSEAVNYRPISLTFVAGKDL